jgi:DNA-directed RNA polymerase specialized sigma24 family protein
MLGVGLPDDSRRVGCRGTNVTDDRANDGSFPSTQWSLVDRAAAADAGVRKGALGDLLQRYLPALRAHLVVRKRIDQERADDLLQGFIASKVLEQGLIARANPEKGRFRALLVTSLNNYVIDMYRHQRGTPPAFSLSDADETPPTGEDSPSNVFDVAWARELLNEVLRRMKTECERARRQDLWGIFECRIVAPILENAPTLPYEQLVKRFGFRSPTQAANALVTAKRMFTRILRSVVGEYAGDEKAIETEIHELQQILARGNR